MAPKVYVAGPLGFTPYGHAFQLEIRDALARRGYEVLDPWASEMNGFFARFGDLATNDELQRALLEVATRPEFAGHTTIDDAHALATTTRGHHDLALLLNRLTGKKNEALIRLADGILACLDDPDGDIGTAAEIGFAAALGKPIVGFRTDKRQTGDNPATVVNLQVEWFITASGGEICRSIDEAYRALDERLAPAP